MKKGQERGKVRKPTVSPAGDGRTALLVLPLPLPALNYRGDHSGASERAGK
jgi:hypothetical protein